MGQSKGRGGDICRTSKPEREILGVRRGGGRRRGGGETREREREGEIETQWRTMVEIDYNLPHAFKLASC